MNVVNVDSYMTSVSYITDSFELLNTDSFCIDEIIPDDNDVRRFFYRCPIFVAFLLNSFNCENPFPGYSNFEQCNLAKEALRGTQHYLRSVLDAASSTNAVSIESLAYFCRLSTLTFEAIDTTVKSLGLEGTNNISIDRLYLAASSLLFKNHFPSDSSLFIKPFGTLTTHMLDVKVSPELSVSNLAAQVNSSDSKLNSAGDDVAVLYPDLMEKRILSSVVLSVNERFGIDVSLMDQSSL